MDYKYPAEILWVARYDYIEGWGIKKHSHDYYQIIYAVSGSGNFEIEDKEFSFQNDMYVLIKPGESHKLEKIKKGVLKTLDIKFNIYDSCLKQSIEDVDCSINVCTDPGIKHLLEKIREEAKERESFYKELALCYLMQILYMTLRKKSDIKTGNIKDGFDGESMQFKGVARLVADYIEKNYMEKISVKDLQSKFGYNKAYLCHSFKTSSGYTIGEYINYVRIKKAKEMITYSDLDLKQISSMVGFENIHHFTRIFKRIEGIPPGQFRKIELEGIKKEFRIDENFVNSSQIDNS
ncbi:MAG TPA: AraC family transcriptional regulator [Clostridiaceae bacterium]|nr:AraC family transcriptional regulator [Clostridiaceae bacterium]